jgi:hypothetical protein
LKVDIEAKDDIVKALEKVIMADVSTLAELD